MSENPAREPTGLDTGNLNLNYNTIPNSKVKTPFKRSKKALSVATWNVRSLVENTGDRRICRAAPLTTNSNSVDRKLDLLAKELKRYKMSIAGIQETKWFGSDIWTTEGFTLLHSGRALPGIEETAKRNKGVGIMLDKSATEAWKNTGEEWEAVSSRIITARLKLARKGQRKPGGTRETSDTYLTVISVYVPTAKATPNIKESFFSDLQDTLDKTPASDILIMLGDFNARVGSSSYNNEHNDWSGTVGKHGVQERNQAGEELLEFCATNQLTVMNTWFEKKKCHLSTWMHPATKKHHMIDYII